MTTRYIFHYIAQDLEKKMVFIGGPRQCGKTHLAKELLKHFNSEKNYFNWDESADKKIIQEKNWGPGRIVTLDEIHKYPKWKNFIKGIYDKENHEHNFIITGSARLDLYKRGGDSMFGRYHYWRLHPFSLNENPIKLSVQKTFERLLKFGGFPEPFLDASERSVRRWRKERFDLILREDIRDLEKINEIQNISLLVDLLKTRVGQLIVVSNLANDLQVAPNTIKRWIEILERMYLVFVVRPYTEKLGRAISKPFKVYFYDNGDVQTDGDGAREGFVYENLVANHLLKYIQFIEDYEGYRCSLHFIRDKEGREVDFVIVKEGKVESLIEVKWSDDQVSKNLIYYAEKIRPNNCLQLVANLKREVVKNKLKILHGPTYLSHLSFT